MIAAFDFSKFTVSDFVVFGIFCVWAFVSLIFWFGGYEKEPKAISAMEIILKHSPPWWRTVTAIVWAALLIYFLLDFILSRHSKI